MKQTGKYLITTDSWFYAPDGLSYKAAWGDIEILPDNFLGVKTNSKSSNWYAKVGTEGNHVIIAGCQIHYAVKCDKEPNTGKTTVESSHEGIFKESQVNSRIYIAD